MYLAQNCIEEGWRSPSYLFNQYKGSLLGEEAGHSNPPSIQVKVNKAIL
jgi:hypothetical protein